MGALVEYSIEGAVARLTLNSPHNRNALSAALVAQLRDGLATAAASGARAVVLGHTGPTFCAGADLSEATSGTTSDVAMDRADQLTRVLRAILELPVPVIAAVDGHVRAGGMGLIAGCDIVVAGSASTFALTEARIGVAPSVISMTLLPRLEPRAAARYFVTGEKFGAEEAARIGLVTVAVPDVAAAAAEFAANLVKGSPQGLAASKALVTSPILATFDRDADVLARQSARLFGSDEAHEGMLAFLEKRPPRWSTG